VLGEPEDRVTRPFAEVVDLDQHVVGDQALHEVATEARQPVGVAPQPAGVLRHPLRSDRACRGKNRVRDTSTLAGRVNTVTPAPTLPNATAATTHAEIASTTLSSPTTLRGMPVTLA
jgi:hypothetical protein